MPIYDFACPACSEQFEALVATAEIPPCPACANPNPRRLFSPLAAAPRAGLRGADARRSNTLRHSRDERLREGFAAKREARRPGSAD
ncbi:MAG: zinc ribbon domain-containing protein [Solirubrobacteraceae bacterium]